MASIKNGVKEVFFLNAKDSTNVEMANIKRLLPWYSNETKIRCNLDFYIMNGSWLWVTEDLT